MGSVDTNLIKEAIMKFLRNNGPSLPIPISRYLGIDTLFTSAFLSELLSEQKIKLTTMRVGGSPVYYIPGTESGIEKFSEYLKSKEKEAFERLKENRFLEDETEQPAIRVALRSIKDFAKSFEKNGKLIWRYYLIPENEHGQKAQEEIKITPKYIPESIMSNVEKAMEEKNPQIIEEHEEIKIVEKPKEKVHKIIEKTEEKPKTIETKEIEFENPFVKKEEPKKKEVKKSEFVLKVIEFINKNNWKIIEELSSKQKEFNCLVEIHSDLGPITFFTVAKDKKTFNEADMTKILAESQKIPLPALILGTGDIGKKSLEFLNKYNSILKFKKIE